MESQLPISPFGWDYINDLCSIYEDNDPVDFILHRVERGEIYTWVGPLLLAVNPGNQILEDFYDEAHQKIYGKEAILLDPYPHVYAVASWARYGLIQGLGNVCQVIVVSGESGTGKTFNSRQILNYLAGIDKNNVKFTDGSVNIAHEIGNVCPLIAAFSTASTKRNSKSSRHGQLIKLQYKDGIIKGACVESFLLERTRVTKESNNFDIFYQLMAGLSHQTANDLGLCSHNEYVILGKYENCQENRYSSEFEDTIRAMQALGFTETCRMEILQVLALLLHMGNIKFKEVDSDSCAIDMDDSSSRKAIKNSCKLSNLNDKDFNELLTSTLICPTSKRRRHTLYRRGLRTVEACRHRLFSIIRWIYDGVFHWLVDRINENIRAKENNLDWLGILDIFGFEFFAKNGIEQLCINYSTERLQLYFMENYLEKGQKELAEEHVAILPSPPTISIYRDRLSIIEQDLFLTFNDVCQSPIAPDIQKISQQFFVRHQDSRKFLKIPSAESFIINHYSRPVKYDIQDILEKNTDKVPIELSSTFYRTCNSLLKIVTSVSEDSLNDRGRVVAKKGTTLSKLKSSLDSLLQQLNKCDTHYIKCVKPLRVGDTWQREEFRNQLTSSGVLDALPLARCIYPVRLVYEEFFERYHIAMPEDNRMDFVTILEYLLGLDDLGSNLHLGRTKIFLTEFLFFELEKYRRIYRANCAKKIINFWRKHRKSKTINDNSIEPFNPELIVTRPSLNSYDENDDVFREENSPVGQWQDNINNNIDEKPMDMPKIALNDHILDLFSPIGMTIASSMPVSTEEIDGQSAPNSTEWESQDTYAAEWLETISTPSDMNSDDSNSVKKISTDSGRSSSEEFVTPRNTKKFRMACKLPPFKSMLAQLLTIEWNIDHSECIIHEDETKKLFYKKRILSKRRISEAPIRFHIKKTCLANSYCLPKSEMPRGLQDCLM